jgi:hypothetical protein
MGAGLDLRNTGIRWAHLSFSFMVEQALVWNTRPTYAP